MSEGRADGRRRERMRPQRERRAAIDPNTVQAAFVEPELDRNGQLVDTATLLTTGHECRFHCTFCDLWRQTLPRPTPAGAIVRQLDAALLTLAPAQAIKLYNASNWFDATAVPPKDWPAIAKRLDGFDRVVVENHPKLCNEAVAEFAALIRGQLEVAIGIESIDPDVLPRLNKSMTLADIETAIARLLGWDILVRAFVLMPPPAKPRRPDAVANTTRWAFQRGVEVVSLVPLRGTQLANAPKPTFAAFERVRDRFDWGLPRRLFIDTWDAADWATTEQRSLMNRWNRTQRIDQQ